MKTIKKILSFSILLPIALVSCGKKGDVSPTGSSSSSWTIANTTYVSSTTGFTNSELLGIDSKVSNDPDIGIQFSSTPAAGNYTIINQYNAIVGANQCSILVSNSTGTPVYVSDAGGTVTVTVSGGKITATFKNVAMGILSGTANDGSFTFTAAGTCSGNLVEQ